MHFAAIACAYGLSTSITAQVRARTRDEWQPLSTPDVARKVTSGSCYVDRMKARVVCPDAVGGGTHSHAGGTCWIGVSGKQEVAGRKVLGMSIRQTVFV